MRLQCVHCNKDSLKTSAGSRIVRFGSYYRSSDARHIQRFRCLNCKKGFSSATFNPCYRQKKRQKNELLRKLLSSNVSQRRAAIILKVHRITIARKFLYLAKLAELKFINQNIEEPLATEIEFDDLETFEHTKCKPISVTLAVETKTRRILGLEVASMKAKGLLVSKAKKYGFRFDDREIARRHLFQRLDKLITEDCLIKSDKNPYYENTVKELLPTRKYVQFKGQRGANGGQGELKKVQFDPLFSLNHTCAMFRANVNRLIRKTWCTTKNIDRLRAHLILYAQFHNTTLL